MGEEIGVKMQSLGKDEKDIEGAKKLLEERQNIMRESNKLEDTVGREEVTIEFEADIFNTFFQLFERWGRDWFFKVEPYLEFRKLMAQTNSQPQDKEKK